MANEEYSQGDSAENSTPPTLREIRRLESEIDRIYAREAHIYNAIFIGLTIIVALYAATQLFNTFSVTSAISRQEEKIEKAVSEGEKRIQAHLEGGIASGARIIPTQAKNNLDATADVFIEDTGSRINHRIRTVYRMKVLVEGEVPAKLLGLEYKFTGNLQKQLSEIAADEEYRDEWMQVNLASSRYTTAGLSDSGIVISPLAPYDLAFVIELPNRTCEEARSGTNILYNTKDISGIEVRPIFERISTIPQTQVFSVDFMSEREISCPQIVEPEIVDTLDNLQ